MDDVLAGSLAGSVKYDLQAHYYQMRQTVNS